MKKAIEGKGLAPAIGPYSAGVEVGNMIFTSGQIAMDPHTGELELDSVAVDWVHWRLGKRCNMCKREFDFNFLMSTLFRS